MCFDCYQSTFNLTHTPQKGLKIWRNNQKIVIKHPPKTNGLPPFFKGFFWISSPHQWLEIQNDSTETLQKKKSQGTFFFPKKLTAGGPQKSWVSEKVGLRLKIWPFSVSMWDFWAVLFWGSVIFVLLFPGAPRPREQRDWGAFSRFSAPETSRWAYHEKTERPKLQLMLWISSDCNIPCLGERERETCQKVQCYFRQ